LQQGHVADNCGLDDGQQYKNRDGNQCLHDSSICYEKLIENVTAPRHE
jgi:hypothetical protein